jgi:hypothetical protein
MSRNLGDGYMLSELNLKCPPGTARNKQLEGEAEAKHNVTANDRVRSVVDYFNTDALKDCRKIHTQLRNSHINITLPWAERGPRLHENAHVREFRDEVDGAKIEADAKWQYFKDDLAHHIARDRHDMGGLFNEAMYPTLDDLEGRHSIEVIFTVVPDADHDCRAGWDTQTQADFVKQTEDKEKQRVSKAMNVLADRCHKFVERVHDRCMKFDGGKVGSYNDTLIPNVKDMIEMCGAFNVNDDPEIKAWIAEMSTNICIVSSQDLRESPELRAEVGAAAGKLAKRIKSSNIGAFGQAPSRPTDD